MHRTQSDQHPLGKVSANLETITRLEQAAGAHRSSAERIADWTARRTTTTGFLVGSATVCVVWMILNANLIRGLAPFDPYPFSMLCMVVSLLGVLYAALILIQQNRLSYLADRRAHVDLQVNLLAEEEITRTLRLLHRLADHFGIQDDDTTRMRDMASETEVAELVAEVDRKLPRDDER
jgi:uncharacterized membrane protein